MPYRMLNIPLTRVHIMVLDNDAPIPWSNFVNRVLSRGSDYSQIKQLKTMYDVIEIR